MSRKLLFILAVLFIGSFNAGCACTLVEPGYAGIRVNMYGTQRGVEDYPIETGRVWYNPMTENVYEYPTFVQQTTWSRTNDTDESVTFNSVEGASLNVDVGIAYAIKAEKVPHIFVKFRQDVSTLTHGYLRTKVRDTLNRHASTMKVTSIFGEGKNQLLTEAEKDLREELEAEGFLIDDVSFVSEFRVDAKVSDSINATITASQKAIEAENKVKQSEAEAQQALALARGRAEAVLLEAESQAKANQILAQSLTPELVQYEALQKWDGQLPTVTGGGATPFINVPTGGK